MNTNEMLEKMNKIVSDKINAEAEERERIYGEIRGAMHTIVDGIDRLKKIAPVVEYIIRNRLVDTSSRFGCDIDFISGGIHHKCGFSPSMGFDLWGITGGGWDGESVFINLNTGKFRVSSWYGETKVGDTDDDYILLNYYKNHGQSSVFSHIRSMAKSIDSYIKSVEDFVSALK